jgi:hypothetical protein
MKVFKVKVDRSPVPVERNEREGESDVHLQRLSLNQGIQPSIYCRVNSDIR